MNIAQTILVATMAATLAACGSSTQADVDKAARDRAADVAKARQDAQPSLDAANRDTAKAQDLANAKVANARAEANRDVNQAVVNQSKGQAKADYEIAVTRVDGDLSVAIEKCKMQSGDVKNACEQSAHTIHDQSVAELKAKLDLANQQAG